VAVTVTMGLTLPLLALVLERQGVAPWLNGVSAATQMLAVMVLAVAIRLLLDLVLEPSELFSIAPVMAGA
jgi:hypothetical protein